MLHVFALALCCAVLSGPLSTATPTDDAAPAEFASVAADTTAEIRPASEETAPVDPTVEEVHAYVIRYAKGLTDAEVRRLSEAIVTEARRYDFDPGLVLAVMKVESRFDPYAVSPVKALGLMQVMPPTGREMALELSIPWHGPQTLFDPYVNLRIGVAYLRQLTDRYDSISTALVAYNWGPGRIDRRLRRGSALPKEYAQLVFAAYGVTATRS